MPARYLTFEFCGITVSAKSFVPLLVRSNWNVFKVVFMILAWVLLPHVLLRETCTRMCTTAVSSRPHMCYCISRTPVVVLLRYLQTRICVHAEALKETASLSHLTFPYHKSLSKSPYTLSVSRWSLSTPLTTRNRRSKATSLSVSSRRSPPFPNSILWIILGLITW